MDPTTEQFNDLLEWLDPDRTRAATWYETIRRNLMKLFRFRGCTDVEALADDTFNRVATKMPGLKLTYVGNQENYFYGVARHVAHEHIRQRGRVIEPLPSSSREDLEPLMKCLDECLAKLPRSDSQMILEYYEKQRRAKIDSHREISSRMGLRPEALRARVYRIRVKLRNCILECLGDTSESNNILVADI